MSDDRSLLGAILVRMGVVTLAELQAALDRQRTSDERLGDILVETTELTQAQLREALDKQTEMRR